MRLVIRYEQKAGEETTGYFQDEVEYAAGYSAIENLKIEPDSVKVSGPDIILDTL